MTACNGWDAEGDPCGYDATVFSDPEGNYCYWHFKVKQGLLRDYRISTLDYYTRSKGDRVPGLVPILSTPRPRQIQITTGRFKKEKVPA